MNTKLAPATFVVTKPVKCERCGKWIGPGETAQHVKMTDHRFTLKSTKLVTRHLGTYDWDSNTCR
jgi:hypothetical protein